MHTVINKNSYIHAHTDKLHNTCMQSHSLANANKCHDDAEMSAHTIQNVHFVWFVHECVRLCVYVCVHLCIIALLCMCVYVCLFMWVSACCPYARLQTCCLLKSIHPLHTSPRLHMLHAQAFNYSYCSTQHWRLLIMLVIVIVIVQC